MKKLFYSELESGGDEIGRPMTLRARAQSRNATMKDLIPMGKPCQFYVTLSQAIDIQPGGT
jgi:hypothetical protein